MAYKFEIIGSALVVTDTVTSKVLIDTPKRDVYYNTISLTNDKKIELFDTNGVKFNGAILGDLFYLSQSQDSAGITFTDASFRDFARTNLAYSDSSGGGGGGTAISPAFVEEPYSSTMSIEYDKENPNSEIYLTGDLNFTLTGTENGDSGILNLYFTGTRTVVLNGVKSVVITETDVMIPLCFIHCTDGLKWYYDLNFNPNGDININGNIFRESGIVKINGNVDIQGFAEFYENNMVLQGFSGVKWKNGPFDPDIGLRRFNASILEVNNGTNEAYAFIKVKSAIVTATNYANDAAADADTTLPSDGLYTITGDRNVKRKP